MFKPNNKDSRTTPCLYCKLWTYFTFCSTVNIFDFEQVISGWVENNSHVYDLLYRFIGNLAYSKLYRKLDW